MKRTQWAILATLAFSAAAALAQSSTPSTPVTGQSIEQRKDNQQQRIGNGMENGSLTAGESGRLENQEKNLNTEERGMRAADGGKLMGYTVLGNLQLIYYRADLLKQAGLSPPKTWAWSAA